MKGYVTARLRRVLLCFVLSGALVLVSQPRAYGDQIPTGWAADNMHPIGYSRLEGRGGAFKMAIKQVNGRWYLYMGHLWHRGWSIVDVTDPANPKYVKFIPGPDNTYTGQLDLHDNLMITGLSDHIPTWGGDPNKPSEEGILFWDISDPLNPRMLSHWKTGMPVGCGYKGASCTSAPAIGNSTGTHRNGYPGGDYVYASAYAQGYTGNILRILDVRNLKEPHEVGRFFLPEQVNDGSKPAADVIFHGPAMIEGNRAYLGYGPSLVILDVSDKTQPKMISQLKFGPPFKSSRLGVHDALPIPGKNLVFVHSEGGGGDTPQLPPTCSGELDLVALVDIKDVTKPRLISVFPTPMPPKGLPYSDFCDKGGRFGPHNTNLEQHLPDVQKQGDLIYLTYFNAGLRLYDIKDPRLPKEVGWFIPPTPTERFGPIPMGKLVTQTEDVLVDTRGNIYITDKQWGLFVLRYTGEDAIAPAASGQ